MKAKVAICKIIPEVVLNFISESCEIVYYEDPSTDFEKEKLLGIMPEVEGMLLGSHTKVTPDILEHGSKLKIICNAAVGYNNLDITSLTGRNIMATNTPEVLNDTTADLVFTLLMTTARRIPELDQYVKNEKWTEIVGKELFGVDVHHKVIGIIGMGQIGTAIAKRANLGFDMEVLYHNRSSNRDAEVLYKAKKCDLDELLSKSDFVCIMTPLTPETRNMIGKREFELMKKTAIFINGSRGETVDEKALIEALKSNQILAAGLDVYQREPINPDNPLLKMNNVVTVPHIGSATYETRQKMAMLAAENLVKGLANERPPSLINVELLE